MRLFFVIGFFSLFTCRQSTMMMMTIKIHIPETEKQKTKFEFPKNLDSSIALHTYICIEQTEQTRLKCACTILNIQKKNFIIAASHSLCFHAATTNFFFFFVFRWVNVFVRKQYRISLSNFLIFTEWLCVWLAICYFRFADLTLKIIIIIFSRFQDSLLFNKFLHQE